MITFWIAAALMLAAALFFVLPALLGKPLAQRASPQRADLNLTVLRDQLHELDADLAAGTIEPEAYRAARHELELRVAQDVQANPPAAADARERRWLPWSLGAAIPVGAAALYLFLGSPNALDPTQASAGPDDKSHAVTQEQIEAMVARLAERLKSKPDDAEGWNMLARSYNALGRYADASEAYRRLAVLIPGDADLLADYADTLAMSTGKSLQGEPEKIIARALEINPKHIKALALYGSAAFERRDYPAAVTRWQKIVALVPADSDIARSTIISINEALSLSGQPVAQAAVPPKAEAPVAPVAAAPASGAKLEGTVALDPALRAQVADTDAVFIFARAAQGPRFPLAVLRKQVKDLPASFVLDDSMSMVDGAKISGFPQVVVGARISKSGSATPSPGDLEGLTAAVAPGAKDLKVVISSRRN